MAVAQRRAEEVEVGPFSALACTFSLVTNVPALARFAQRAYGHFPAAASGGDRFTLLERVEEDGASRWTLGLGDTELCDTRHPWATLSEFMWHVNRRALSGASGHLLLHAGAVVRDGEALLLPAASGAGKSTLVASLVAAGFGYLSDEAAAIEADTFIVHPYPKPISVGQGSWEALAGLQPDPDPDLDPFLRDWHLDPAAIGPAGVAGPTPPRHLVFHRYREGVPVRLEPLSPGRAVLEAAHHSFNLDQAGEWGFRQLAELARRTTSYQLVYGDVTEAVRALTEVAA